VRLGRRLAVIALGVLLAGGFYMALIDTSSLPELYVGAVITLLAAAVFEAAREQGMAEASVAAGWLARSWRAVVKIPRDIGLVSLTALQQLFSPAERRGRMHAVPFERGSGSGARDAGRRALAEALGSLAPNTIVVGIDRERKLIVAHRLRARAEGDPIDVLGLG
jgi:hypothetical protein